MIGQVYRVDFPDGDYYIGSTKHNLRIRFSGHLS